MSRGAPWRTARRLFALHQGGNDWYKIKAQADGPTQLYIYDEIGYFGVGASDLVRDLSDVKGPIQVHINSPGGEVWDGITIYNTLMGRRDVTVVIDGLAASIASVIACAGNPTIMAKSGQMVIHDGFCMAIGNAQDMRETADKLDRASNTIASIYADRSGKTEKHWRDLMKVETTFGAQECLDAGLVDKIIEHEARNAVGGKEQDWDLTGVLKNAASVPYVGLQQHRHIPMTGRHSHDHAAFGAEDHDDGTHQHVHEHNNDADHDHDHDQESNKPGAGSGTSYNTDWDTVQVSLLNHILDERFTEIQNWDAAAAFAKCKTASDFRSIAFEKSNDSSDTSAAHYGLPHHASPGGGPDKGGVIAALGRWNQTQGLKNKDGALAHLKAHAKTLGLPSGDGDKDRLDDMSDWTDEEISHFIKALKGA